MKRLTPIASATLSTDRRSANAPRSSSMRTASCFCSRDISRERGAELLFDRRHHALERPLHPGQPQAADDRAFPLQRDVARPHLLRPDELGAERVGDRFERAQEWVARRDHGASVMAAAA